MAGLDVRLPCGHVGHHLGLRRPPPPGFEHHVLQQQRPGSIFRTIQDFEVQGLLGEGVNGQVYRARDRDTGEAAAIKRLRKGELAVEEALKMCCCRGHPSVIKLKDVVLGHDEGDVFLVMELAEKGSLKSIMQESADKKLFFGQSEKRQIMSQLLQGVAHIHRAGIIHQDLKTDNLLVTGSGQLKICDFGLSCTFQHGIPVPYIGPVVTPLYRAPELFMPDCIAYTPAIDIWSVGCIMGELMCNKPLFPAKDVDDILPVIFYFLGHPDKLRQRIPPDSLSDLGFHLLTRLLTFDPRHRITAQEALRHPWFTESSTSCSESIAQNKAIAFLFPPVVKKGNS